LGTKASFWPVFTSVLVMRFKKKIVSMAISRYWGIKNVYRVNAGGQEENIQFVQLHGSYKSGSFNFNDREG
jgi:hypothetical protein